MAMRQHVYLKLFLVCCCGLALGAQGFRTAVCDMVKRTSPADRLLKAYLGSSQGTAVEKAMHYSREGYPGCAVLESSDDNNKLTVTMDQAKADDVLTATLTDSTFHIFLIYGSANQLESTVLVSGGPPVNSTQVYLKLMRPLGGFPKTECYLPVLLPEGGAELLRFTAGSQLLSLCGNFSSTFQTPAGTLSSVGGFVYSPTIHPPPFATSTPATWNNGETDDRLKPAKAPAGSVVFILLLGGGESGLPLKTQIVVLPKVGAQAALANPDYSSDPTAPGKAIIACNAKVGSTLQDVRTSGSLWSTGVERSLLDHHLAFGQCSKIDIRGLWASGNDGTQFWQKSPMASPTENPTMNGLFYSNHWDTPVSKGALQSPIFPNSTVFYFHHWLGGLDGCLKLNFTTRASANSEERTSRDGIIEACFDGPKSFGPYKFVVDFRVSVTDIAGNLKWGTTEWFSPNVYGGKMVQAVLTGNVTERTVGGFYMSQLKRNGDLVTQPLLADQPSLSGFLFPEPPVGEPAPSSSTWARPCLRTLAGLILLLLGICCC